MLDVSPIKVVQQRPNDLILAIFRQDHLSDFTILRQQSVCLHGWRFTFCILGESHLVSIIRGDQLIMQEVLACTDIPAEDCLHHHHFEDLQDTAYNLDNYQITICFDADCGNVSDANTLLYEFPAIEGYSPITKITWQQTGDSINWWTLHEYPQKDHVIKVYSYSTLKGLLNGSTTA